MKVIDLLNRIAKDEGIPIKIKFKGKEYEWSQEFYDYRCIDINHKYLVEDLETEDLNRTCEEIPIIEDKKIRKLYLNDEYLFSNNLSKEFTREDRRLLDSNFETIRQKFNEIIDYLNKEKE